MTLVLGAGGPVGHAFHAGVLRALAEAAGWNAASAELIVGTSAGAQTGALLRAGLSVRDLFARVVGAPLSPDGAALTRALPFPLGRSTSEHAVRRWPASSAYLWSALRRPWHARPGRLVAALLPDARHDNQPLGDGFRRLFGADWPARPLWITSVDLDSGARVVFGRHGAPAVDVGTAVRCSSSVPGLRRAVRVGAQRYVDGGIASAVHLDLLHASAPGLVVVVSPLSRFAPMRLLLRAELRALAARGARVVAFEPCADVARVMGWNPMNARAAERVAEVAYRAALARLAASPLGDWLGSVGERAGDGVEQPRELGVGSA